MDQAEEDILVKLHDIAYYITIRNHSFIEFKYLIELEEIYGVSYSLRKCMNEMGCRNIIQNIFFFACFIAILRQKNGELTLCLYYAMSQQMLALLNKR